MSFAMELPIPVIDLFAGPGGLGEGFSSHRLGALRTFKIVLSIEKDPIARETLKLRTFFRQFEDGKAPDEYYRYLQGEIDRDTLYQKYPKESEVADSHAWCAELGAEAFPESLVDARVKNALKPFSGRPWVLIGGPPCQAYSLVGRARRTRERQENLREYESDPRHYLYRQYLHIIDKHRPSIFVMENVKGLLSSSIKGERVVENIFGDLLKLGYHLCPLAAPAGRFNFGCTGAMEPREFIIRCENYGIPQARHRVIILGIKRDLGCPHNQLQYDGSDAPSVLDAIGDLPPLRSGLSTNDSADQWTAAITQLRSEIEKFRSIDFRVAHIMDRHLDKIGLHRSRGHDRFQKCEVSPAISRDWYHDPRLGGVCNHGTRGHIPEDLRRYFYLACHAEALGASPSLVDLPAFLRPKHRNVQAGNLSVFGDRFRVQMRDDPSTTITSHIAKDGHYFIHYDARQCRALTVREAARLQTFPDNYFFEGPRTSQYQQVGNAVPPLAASQIANVVYHDLIGRVLRGARNGHAEC